MSIFSSLRYCLGHPHDLSSLWLAMGFMPFGLFFDFMDGKVARWRKKSSLMGQELDSLADLVSHAASHIHKESPRWHLTGLLRCGPRGSRLLHRFPHHPRHHHSHLLRPLWSLPPRPVQCYCCISPKRPDWEKQIFRRHTNSDNTIFGQCHGILVQSGLVSRSNPTRCMG